MLAYVSAGLKDVWRQQLDTLLFVFTCCMLLLVELGCSQRVVEPKRVCLHQAGEELLLDYGTIYWKTREGQMLE